MLTDKEPEEIRSCGKRFKADFRASCLGTYTKSCQHAAVAKGSPETEAGAWCACMAQEVVEHHTPAELFKLDVDPNSSKTREATVTASNACQQQFFVRNFTHTCTQSAVGKGSVEAEIEPFCACLGQHLVDSHTTAELTAYESETDSPAYLKAAILVRVAAELVIFVVRGFAVR